LLDNALRYTPAGGRIVLTLMRDERAARVSVADSGPGIPAHALPNLFERFYTADPARAGRGAGLGLAIAREIALAHGGDLTVVSEAGRGSRFTLTLPAAPRSSAAAIVPAPQVARV
jgi:signal transduction histidine kinase